MVFLYFVLVRLVSPKSAPFFGLGNDHLLNTLFERNVSSGLRSRGHSVDHVVSQFARLTLIFKLKVSSCLRSTALPKQDFLHSLITLDRTLRRQL